MKNQYSKQWIIESPFFNHNHPSNFRKKLGNFTIYFVIQIFKDFFWFIKF